MAESIAADIIGRVLELLGTSAVERIVPFFGGRGKLNELQLTMEMTKLDCMMRRCDKKLRRELSLNHG